MKNKKITKLILPITVATLATASVPAIIFAGSINIKKSKKDKTDRLVRLKNTTNPANVDLTDKLEPISITSNSQHACFIHLSIPTRLSNNPDFVCQYRYGSVSTGQWYSGESGSNGWVQLWTGIALPVGQDIIVQVRCGWEESNANFGVLSEEDTAEYDENFFRIAIQNPLDEELANVKIGGSAMSLFSAATKDVGGEWTFDSWQGSTELLKESCLTKLFYVTDSAQYIDQTPRVSFVSDFLPFKTLTKNCYKNMFTGSGIITAPALPAPTLAEGCYESMFKFCNYLGAAPVLPATRLVKDCYKEIFYDCKQMKSISLGNITNFNTTYFTDWVKNVDLNGIMLYNGLDEERSSNAIPTNFTVVKDQNLIDNYTQILEIQGDGSTSTVESKNKVRLFKDEKFGKIKDQLPKYTPNKTGDVFNKWIDGDGQTRTITDDTLVSELPDVLKPVYGFTPVVMPDVCNLIVEEATKIHYCISHKDAKLSYSLNGAPEVELNEGEQIDVPANSIVQLYIHADQSGKEFGTVMKNANIEILEGKVKLTGSVKSLLGDNWTTWRNCDCSGLFRDSTGITEVDDGFIPKLDGVTTIPENCFNQMFGNCSSLKKTCKMEYSSYGKNACYWMYLGCTSLTDASNISKITSVDEASCFGMFDGCTLLQTIPEVDVTSVANSSFAQMFQNCSDNLKDASKIKINAQVPDNQLLSFTCCDMFNGCKALEKPCYVNITNITEYIYNAETKYNEFSTKIFYQMYYGCTKLKFGEAGQESQKFLYYSYSKTIQYKQFGNIGTNCFSVNTKDRGGHTKETTKNANYDTWYYSANLI